MKQLWNNSNTNNLIERILILKNSSYINVLSGQEER